MPIASVELVCAGSLSSRELICKICSRTKGSSTRFLNGPDGPDRMDRALGCDKKLECSHEKYMIRLADTMWTNCANMFPATLSDVLRYY